MCALFWDSISLSFHAHTIHGMRGEKQAETALDTTAVTLISDKDIDKNRTDMEEAEVEVCVEGWACITLFQE